MKKIFIILLFLGALASCTKDFVTEKPGSISDF